MKIGRAVHSEGEGHYAVSQIVAQAGSGDVPQRLASLLNERAQQGWQLVRTQEVDAGKSLLVIFERTDP